MTTMLPALEEETADALDQKYHLESRWPGLWDRLTTALARKMQWELTFAERVFNEAIWFLQHCGTNSGQAWVPSDVVDEAVDFFILRTQDYALFCAEVVGTFVHHIPLDDPEHDNPREHLERYRHTLQAVILAGRMDPTLWTDRASDCNDKATTVTGKCRFRAG